MPGWTLLFALLSVSCAFAGVTGGARSSSTTIAGLVFGILLLASLFARMLRGTA